MNSNETTSIMFLPVCLNCMSIIKTVVDCNRRVGVICGEPRILGADYDIVPARCPYCDTPINSIDMPTQLPFNYIAYARSKGEW